MRPDMRTSMYGGVGAHLRRDLGAGDAQLPVLGDLAREAEVAEQHVAVVPAPHTVAWGQQCRGEAHGVAVHRAWLWSSREEDVPRGDVAMEHAPLVHVRHRRAELRQPRRHQLALEGPALLTHLALRRYE